MNHLLWNHSRDSLQSLRPKVSYPLPQPRTCLPKILSELPVQGPTTYWGRTIRSFVFSNRTREVLQSHTRLTPASSPMLVWSSHPGFARGWSRYRTEYRTVTWPIARGFATCWGRKGYVEIRECWLRVEGSEVCVLGLGFRVLRNVGDHDATLVPRKNNPQTTNPKYETSSHNPLNHIFTHIYIIMFYIHILSFVDIA